jgi:hypothetical protein
MELAPRVLSDRDGTWWPTMNTTKDALKSAVPRNALKKAPPTRHGPGVKQDLRAEDQQPGLAERRLEFLFELRHVPQEASEFLNGRLKQ